MTQFAPPPTYADPVVVDEVTGRARFNPLWLKWFLDITAFVSAAGGSSGGISHNSLTGIQGGGTGEYFHLTASNLNSLIGGGNTTLHTHTAYQPTSEKNAASGYAGLNGTSRITKGADAQDDVVIDLATKGLVMKDTQATPHYWRLSVTTAGILVTTDLGTVKP